MDAVAQDVGFDLCRLDAPVERRGAPRARQLAEVGVVGASELEVASPRHGDRRRPRVARLLPRARRRGPAHVPFLERLRLFQESVGELKGPAVVRTVPSAHRPRVELPWIHQVPAVLVGLGAVEDRRLDLERAAIEAGREHAHRDVRRVEGVVAERRHRVVGRGRAVHERDRPERGLADRRAGQRQGDPLSDRLQPHRRGLHEEVVRMLVVDERIPLEGLADLEDVAVALRADRRRVETEHQVERELAFAGALLGHAHPPVRRLDLALAARTALVVVHDEHDGVLHERPSRAAHVVLHPRVRILGEGVAASGDHEQEREQYDRSPVSQPPATIPRARSHVTMMSCTTSSSSAPGPRD